MNKPQELNTLDLGEMLFQAAAAQMRADVLRLAAEKAAKELAQKEEDREYIARFLMRWKKSHPVREDIEESLADVNREILSSFDRHEAVGSSSWGSY